jgi:hypothetical protein
MRMNRELIGVILLAAGLGILFSHALPGLLWLWFVPLIAGGILFWRRRAVLLPVGLMTLSLFWGFVGSARPVETTLPGVTLTASDEALRQLTSVRTVRVINDAGKVMIRPGRQFDIRVRYSGSRELPDNFRAELSDAVLTIIGTQPDRGDERLEAFITITLPRDVNLQIESSRADIDVAGAQGAITVHSDSGKVDLVFDEAPQASVQVVTNRADIRMVLPRVSDVGIHAISRSRSFAGDLVRITPEEHRLNLGTELHEVFLKTTRGTVTVQTR